MHKIEYLFVCVFFVICFNSYGQSFNLMRYNEDYHYLKDSVSSLYNLIQFMPLSRDKTVYASFGGEARFEQAYFNNEDWGKFHIGHNDFLLQRYDLYANVYFGNRVRIFAQIRSAWENGRKDGPRPIDEDKLNIQNLFVDLNLLNTNSKTVTVRLGRQEMDYGSGRLISVREGVNLRLYFTGIKFIYTSELFNVNAFAVEADSVKTGVFDNKPTQQINLWGAYISHTSSNTGNLDFYYLGIHVDNAVFEEGVANELRHTVGARFWRSGEGFIYNFESAYQFGSFGRGKINAWTASADIGYFFQDTKWKLSVNLRNDYISGDKKPGDGILQTFNPLYPKGGYFGFDPQIGPVNLIDIHPYVNITPVSKFTVQGEVVFNWRYSTGDGLYTPGGGYNLAGASSERKFIGTGYLASAIYSFNPFYSANAGIQYFKTGSFIRDIISEPKDGLFVNIRLAFKF